MPPPLPEYRLLTEPLTAGAEAAAGYEWADPSIGKRHRIGGVPDWIQGDQTPRCSCGRPMTFYAQLDGIGDDFDLADCGLIYVFVCFEDFETKSVFQTG